MLWHVADPQPIQLAHPPGGYFMNLPGSGQTYVAANSSLIQVGEVATGVVTWQVIVPHEHAAEQPR